MKKKKATTRRTHDRRRAVRRTHDARRTTDVSIPVLGKIWRQAKFGAGKIVGNNVENQ